MKLEKDIKVELSIVKQSQKASTRILPISKPFQIVTKR